MKFNEIFHLGVVVRDLDKAVKIYTEELGYGPFDSCVASSERAHSASASAKLSTA